MKKVCHVIIPLVLLLCLSTGVMALSNQAKEARSTAYYYFDLLLFGNVESAVGLWTPSAIERAGRLGIEYDDVIFKPDCNSPVVYRYDQLKQYFVNALRMQGALDDTTFLKIKFDIKPHEKRYEYFYFMTLDGQYYWFTFAEDYYAKDWTTRETEYFRIHLHPKTENLYNEIAVTALDDFVEKVAGVLETPKERLKLLKEQKIDYYLCHLPTDIEHLSNTRADAFYNQANDAVFSIGFPDYNVVAQLLINFRLQRLPLATMPFIRDGLAVYLGGSWQRDGAVLLDFGEYLLHNRVVEIDSLLIPPDTAPAFDLVSPASAVLVEYLVGQLGWEAFFNLYRDLSGSVTEIEGMTALTIKRKLAKYLGDEWKNITAAVNEYADNRNAHGGAIFPGMVKAKKKLLDDSGLVISRSNDWIQINYVAPTETKPDMVVFFGSRKELENKKSPLRREQYKDDTMFSGYRFSIRVDQNEIGLYDYATNRLLAKYVSDFDPSEDYYDTAANRVTAYFDIDLLDGIFPETDDCLILRGH